MIHTFSVSNLRSIREKVVLDLRIPNTAPDVRGFRRSVAKPTVRLPTVVVLIGANGSGKTALLEALVTAARVAGRPAPSEPDTAPIPMLIPFFSFAWLGEPTEFCLEFEGDWLAPDKPPKLFRYEVVLERRRPWDPTSTRFCSEALSYFPKGRPRRLFERLGSNGEVYSSTEFGVTGKDPRLKAVRADASVIATLAQLNVPVAMRLAEWLNTLTILTNTVHDVSTRPPIHRVADVFQKVPKLSDWFSERIQCSDLGISEFSVTESGDEKTLSFGHHGIDFPINIRFESSGTRRLSKILPLLYRGLTEGVPAVFDEIDGDLHVDIVVEILSWFRSHETNPQNSQLFMTSHNVGLLDDLEKEELFIVEKTRDGATRLHGAQDVKGLRRDVRLYPKYRAGVLGGVPRVG